MTSRAEPDPPVIPDADARPLAAAGWTLLAFVVSRGIALASTFVLARLLKPADFGLIAVCLLVVMILGSVTTLGLRGSLVVERIDGPMLATALTLLLAAGALGAAGVALAAGALASLFGNHELAPVLRAMSVLLLLGGVVAFYEARLQRALRFRARFATQIVQSCVFAAVAVIAAAAGAGVWSLVAGYTASSAVYAGSLVIVTRGEVRPGFKRGLVRALLRPARGFMAHGLIQNIQQNVDIGATTYFLSAQATGHYSLAYRLADLPYAAFTEPVAAVTFPALARSHRRRESTSELGLQLLTVVTVFTSPVCLLMSAAAGPLVAVAFGDKWGPMAGALSVLGCWAAIVQVEAALGWFLNSLGLASINAAVSAAVLVPLLPVVMIAAANGGIVAVAWVMLAAGIATTALLVLRVRRATGLPVRRQLRAVAGTTVAGVALWGCARALVGALSEADALSTLLLAAAGGLGVYILVLRLLDPGSLRIGLTFAVDAVRNLRGQSPT